MTRIRTERSELDVTVTGEGEPVLMIHGSVIGGTFDGMAKEPGLADGFQLITYYRQGFANSSHSEPPYSIPEQAADALAVLRHVGADRAHVVGHSYGGVISMQLALDAPESVHSLTLLEPPVMMVPSAEAFAAELGVAAEAYAAGDRQSAIDTFMRTVSGPDYRAVMDAALGEGCFDQAVADSDTLFAVEFPALQEWSFGPEKAHEITCPVMIVQGENSVTFFVEGCELLKEWFPQAEGYVLPGADHLLQVANPGDMAERLAPFAAAHPIAAHAGRASD